jgi:hypothetical protein
MHTRTTTKTFWQTLSLISQPNRSNGVGKVMLIEKYLSKYESYAFDYHIDVRRL